MPSGTIKHTKNNNPTKYNHVKNMIIKDVYSGKANN